MLRPFLLFLSHSSMAQKFVLNFPLARRVARRYVAGERLEEALEVMGQLRSKGLDVALDMLGENVVRVGAAREATQSYLRVVESLRSVDAEGYVSLKLTQLGLDEDPQLARDNLRIILEAAQAAGIFVRIDMEASMYTENTLEIFRESRREFDNVGVVIQASLRRSKADIAMIQKLQGQVRLCKGAYAEPPSVAYQSRREITRAMVDLMQDLLREGHRPAIASHDEEVIQATIAYANLMGLSKDQFEFQMLYGIRKERQLELSRDGYRVRVYVPFGSDWYPYFMRRLAERPANLLFFLTALVRG